MPSHLAFFASFVALLLALFLALAGCGDADSRGDAGLDAGPDAGDAAPDATTDGEPSPPMPPMEAAAPVFGPCPSGYRSVMTDDGLELCDPWPAGGRAACSGADAHFVGTPGCERVGTACPADGLPAEMAGGATTWWVSAGAGGTGTRADPWSTIAEAVAAASAGDVIAIGRGTYPESVAVPGGVTLRGACVDEVVITGDAGVTAPAVSVTAGTVTVTNLRVGPSAGAGISVIGAGRGLTLEDVVVTGTTAVGVVADSGAHVALRRVVIRDLVGVAGRGPGISARGGATVAGEQVVIDGAVLAGLLVGGAGTTVSLARVLVFGTAPGAAPGIGVVVSGRASLTLTESAIEQNHGAGGIVSGAGTLFVLEDSTIRDNLPTGTGQFGRGLNMETGAEGRLTRCLVSGNRDVGIYVNAAATLDIEDSVVRDTDSETRDQHGGHGIEVQGEAAIAARRVVLTNNSETGALISEGSTLTASDLVISDSRGRLADGSMGIGLQIQSAATAELDRIVLDNNRYLGMTVFEAGPVGIRDLVVRRTQANFEGRYGRGLDVEDAIVTVERALLLENHDLAVFASTNAHLDLTDLTIRDTLPEAEGGRGGRGIAYQQGAEGRVTRVLIDNSYEVGFGVADGAGFVTVTDMVVRNVRPQSCAQTTCPGEDFGVGVLVANSSMTMSRFLVEDADLCGIQLAVMGQLDLDHGTVRGSTIGACVQVPGYDFGRLTTDVRYVDNGTNLDTTDLPVPPPPPLSEL